MTLREFIGLEEISFLETIGLCAFVIIPMVIMSITNPVGIGYTFIAFGSIAYLIAVYTSSRKEGQ